jgi:putative flippase GtrA
MIGRELARFLLVGGVGFLVDASAFLALGALLPLVPARLSALAVAITATWWLNRRFTFASMAPNRWAEWARYAAGSALGASVNAAVSLGLLWQVPRVGPVLAVACGALAGLAVNFLAAKHIAFRIGRAHPSSAGS